MPMLEDACPSFPSARKSKETEDKDSLYVSLGTFANHLLELQQVNHLNEFKPVAEVIERLHLEGDSYVKEAATVGLLEGIQNIWQNNGVDPELFFPFLLPESAKWWRSLNDFWDGKAKFVGEGL